MTRRGSTRTPLPSRESSKRAMKNSSPLVGEGGVRHRRTPGEGASSTVAKARSLRGRMTDAERKLWYLLRDRRFSGAKFRRQVPLGAYVADFLSFERQVVIEVDGGQHSGRASDVARDTWFRSQGFTVVRFWNNDVLTNLDGVAARLLEIIAESTPHPVRSRTRLRSHPLPQGDCCAIERCSWFDSGAFSL